MTGTVKQVVFWGGLSAIALGALLWPSDAWAQAHDEGDVEVARRRLVQFLTNANLKAVVTVRTGADGAMYLAVTGPLGPQDRKLVPATVAGIVVRLE